MIGMIEPTQIDQDEAELQGLVDEADNSYCGVNGCPTRRMGGTVWMLDETGHTTPYRVCGSHFEVIIMLIPNAEDEEDDEEEIEVQPNTVTGSGFVRTARFRGDVIVGNSETDSDDFRRAHEMLYADQGGPIDD